MPTPKTVFRSLRVDPEMFVEIEALAAAEHISVNALCNALFSLCLALDETEEGRAAIHLACTNWRSRYEHAMPEGRQRRLEAHSPETVD